ncbi:MAG: DUF2326 domain-containing protein [Clostridia bacterium]|nr:DUF2326 domain-containing protein [Clostridia bacterium]
MLREIFCEEFHQKKIKFDNGLNVILGTKTADNSIGKSTFMLVIDFVFGGNTYAHSEDILKNVAPHEICFKFEFEGKDYYFSRKNTEPKMVWRCNEEYNHIESITNDDFCEWLSKKYNIDLPNLSFRDAVGRYIRAYGKKNIDENRPLNAASVENGNKACISLLKLFGRYSIISQLEEKTNAAKEALSIFEKAQKHQYVSKIGKKEYDANTLRIKNLQDEIMSISSGLEKGLLEADAVASEEAIRIKKELSRTKRICSGIKRKLDTLNDNIEYKFSQTSTTYDELKKFFPIVNIKHIEEIESFHKNISKIFKEELKEEKKLLLEQLKEYEAIAADLEDQLQKLIKNPNLSKIVLQKYADILKLINKMKAENDSFEKLVKLKNEKKEVEELLLNAKNEQFGIIEKMLNTEMDRINSELYTEKFNAPTVHFSGSNYTFFTPNDTGTGIAFKGLVVFDLAIMHLSKLPILVHDSVVLKQISDNAVERIIDQYIACGKQVVIALDKQESYSEKTEKMLLKYANLQLEPNGKELFGKSWGKSQP